MARRKPKDIHVNQERWLVSYADFITLLFAFFVVMYSVSQVNQGKYRVLSDTMSQAFNARNLNPALQDKLTPTGAIVAPVSVGPVPLEDTEKATPPAEDAKKSEAAVQSSSVAKGDGGAGEANDELKKMSSQVTEKFTQLINDKLIKVSSNALWLQIELKDSILFSSGGVEPSPQAQAIFTEIAEILQNYSNPIQIEGFTDNVPINSSRFPTNWELSSTRATEIVKFLITKGVAPERLAAVGYGEFQPVADNDTEAGRAQNRRVAVMVAKRKLERPKARP